MATTSFDKKFVVKSKKAARKLLKDLDNPQVIKVHKKDLDKENEEGIKLLKKLRSV